MTYYLKLPIVNLILGALTGYIVSLGGIAILASVSVLLLSIGWHILQSRRTQNTSPLYVNRAPEPARGLILLVRNKEVCQAAIGYHKNSNRLFERCWLIASSQSKEVAESIQGEFGALCKDEIRIVNDVHDPAEIYVLVNKIYEQAWQEGFKPEEIIADYTGMTAGCSVGMVLACHQAGRRIQYTPADYDTALKAQKPRQPIETYLPTQKELKETIHVNTKIT